jgi:hypothetical protein
MAMSISFASSLSIWPSRKPLSAGSFFEQQLEQAKDNLANAEEAMKETEQKTGVIQLDSQARALIESAASLRAQVAAKEVQFRECGRMQPARIPSWCKRNKNWIACVRSWPNWEGLKTAPAAG